MSRKSSSNSEYATIIAILFFISVVWIAINIILGIVKAIVSAISYFFINVAIGANACLPFVLLFGLPLAGLPFVFYFTHRKPLTYEQVVSLARRRAKAYASKNYKFSKARIASNPAFKTHMDITGRWYTINEPLSTFPSLVADLLKGKHHEWVIIALEKNGIVYKMWTNKGTDNQSVSFNCDLNDIIQRSIQENGCSVLRFHNHPNPDPSKYTTLLASELDFSSAKACSEIVCNSGLNWFDFVCAQGNYILFYSKISDSFRIHGSTESDLVDLCGITPRMDYHLQKEYHHLNINFSNIKLNVLISSVVVTVLLIIFFIVGINISKNRNAEADSQTDSTITMESTSSQLTTTTTTISTTTEATPVNEIWATSPTPLDQFDYYRRDDIIYLEKYIGDDRKVWIADKYTVDGETYIIANTVENLFENRDVFSVILPEGITQISSSIFSGSDVKYVYIPKSLESDDDSGLGSWYSRLHNTVRVFYGGCEDDWLELTNYVERSSIDVVQIIYDVTIDELPEKHGQVPTYRSPFYDHKYRPTDICYFKFYIDDNTICLTEYTGENEFVWIDTEYTIDGITYEVCDTLSNLTGLSKASTIIISDGFTAIDEDMFLSCHNLQNLYLPASLDPEQCGAFYLHFHKDISVVSYGGSQEDWSELTDGIDRVSINATDIKYNEDYEALKQRILDVE